ncbi:MAG TPA: hypothetical protein VGL89_09425 [Candidatus Koribacter sp.]|jgi:hypothetical protein
MMTPWKNPEFTRHFRREMRPVRAAMTLVIPLLVCLLVMLVMRVGERDGQGRIVWHDYWNDLYIGLLAVQGVVLALWCVSTCGQAISSERQLKTFDFLRTTRLNSAELLTGSVAGRPFTAYVMVAVTLPITLLAGTAAGYAWWRVLASMGVIVVVCLTFALFALLFSLLTEKPRIGELIAIVVAGCWAMVQISHAWAFRYQNSAIPALTVLPALEKLNGYAGVAAPLPVRLFGAPIAPAMMTVFLYGTAAAWLALMLVRNLKRDREEMRLLTRWQALLLLICVNVIFLAQVLLRGPYGFLFIGSVNADKWFQQQVQNIVSNYVVLNAVVFYLIGLAMLPSAGELKTWFREKQRSFGSYWGENAPPIPWIALAAASAWVVLAAVVFFYRHEAPRADWSLGWTALRLGVLLVYATRDVIFLQWCGITRMKSPLVKGVLLLGLYYFVVSMIAAFVQAAMGAPDSLVGYAIVTPVGALANQALLASVQGAGAQVGIIVLLLLLIRQRFVRVSSLTAPSPA